MINGIQLQRTVHINNPQGLHLRPSAAFAQLAMNYQSNVTLCFGETVVNGKSPLELMMLAAPRGSQLVLSVDGPDADVALGALAELLEAIPEDSPDSQEEGLLEENPGQRTPDASSGFSR